MFTVNSVMAPVGDAVGANCRSRHPYVYLRSWNRILFIWAAASAKLVLHVGICGLCTGRTPLCTPRVGVWWRVRQAVGRHRWGGSRKYNGRYPSANLGGAPSADDCSRRHPAKARLNFGAEAGRVWNSCYGQGLFCPKSPDCAGCQSTWVSSDVASLSCSPCQVIPGTIALIYRCFHEHFL